MESNAASLLLSAVRTHGVLDSCGLIGRRRARQVMIHCVLFSGWGNHPDISSKFEALTDRTSGVYSSKVRASLLYGMASLARTRSLRRHVTQMFFSQFFDNIIVLGCPFSSPT